jgi:acetyl-CoA carboxylase biotin carboxylase subunit
MGEAALKIARAAGYSNAGTAEFLVDRDRNFYFLEMNTRLQVEHPVTELVTSLDLVHLQLDLAAGAPLSLRQQDIRWNGHAIECRLYAEDPANNFFPSPGVIERLELPSGPGVRLDSGVYEGWRVPLEYDPLLAKLAVWAPDRPAAIARLERALSETVILGIRNNIHFFRQLLADPAVLSGNLHTTFLNNFHYQDPPPPTGEALAAALAAFQPPSAPLPRPRRSAWRNS